MGGWQSVFVCGWEGVCVCEWEGVCAGEKETGSEAGIERGRDGEDGGGGRHPVEIFIVVFVERGHRISVPHPDRPRHTCYYASRLLRTGQWTLRKTLVKYPVKTSADGQMSDKNSVHAMPLNRLILN